MQTCNFWSCLVCNQKFRNTQPWCTHNWESMQDMYACYAEILNNVLTLFVSAVWSIYFNWSGMDHFISTISSDETSIIKYKRKAKSNMLNVVKHKQAPCTDWLLWRRQTNRKLRETRARAAVSDQLHQECWDAASGGAFIIAPRALLCIIIFIIIFITLLLQLQVTRQVTCNSKESIYFGVAWNLCG